MSFWRGLLMARSHLTFLVGLLLALVVIWQVEASAPPPPPIRSAVTDYGKLLHTTAGPALRKPAPLSETERAWAKAAFRYFENNYQPETGFVNSVHGYPSATLWDLGSYAMALLAARDLELIDGPTFETRVGAMLASLERLPLVEGLLPNKVYNTKTLRMVDYRNADSAAGIGWSAIDIARLGVPLTLMVWRHPAHTDRIRAILSRWRLDEVVSQGRLQGAMRGPGGKLLRVQEGRFGYEQYAARSLFLLGLDVSRAQRYELDPEFAKVSGQLIAADQRLPAAHGGTHNAVLSEPYILEGLEFGLDQATLHLARAVYLAQVNRARETRRLVAVSEDNLDRAPYFVYNAVYNDRRPWVAFTPDGKDAEAHKTLSLKAAFGWSYLFAGDYADQLRGAAGALLDEQRGFFSGRYDADGAPNKAVTANTNGVALETLWYRVRGPLLPAGRSR